jgi:hypothetical protein
MKPIRYVWNEFIYKIKYCWNPAKWIPATILCIRFPFLYPRNRFSGKHYANWTLHNLQCEAHSKAYELKGEFGNKENPVHIEKISNWWALVEKFYPFIESCIGVFHIIPAYTELDALPSGWRKAFGIYICKDLKRALLEDGGRKKLRGYRIEQIKEKFGELCWYDHGGNEETNRIIYKYTYISLHTCIVCGKSADYVTRGWIEPYCKEHLPDHIDPNDPEQVHEYFTEDFKFYGVYRINFDKKKESKDNGREKEGPGGN